MGDPGGPGGWHSQARERGEKDRRQEEEEGGEGRNVNQAEMEIWWRES